MPLPIILDPCVHCGVSTAAGYGNWVNRLGWDDGWACAMCAGPECDACDKQIYIDADVSDLNGNGYYHNECVPTKLTKGN